MMWSIDDFLADKSAFDSINQKIAKVGGLNRFNFHIRSTGHEDSVRSYLDEEREKVFALAQKANPSLTREVLMAKYQWDRVLHRVLSVKTEGFGDERDTIGLDLGVTTGDWRLAGTPLDYPDLGLEGYRILKPEEMHHVIGITVLARTTDDEYIFAYRGPKFETQVGKVVHIGGTSYDIPGLVGDFKQDLILPQVISEGTNELGETMQHALINQIKLIGIGHNPFSGAVELIYEVPVDIPTDKACKLWQYAKDRSQNDNPFGIARNATAFRIFTETHDLHTGLAGIVPVIQYFLERNN